MLKSRYIILKYRFIHWLFQWNQDEEGALVFTIAGILHFLKYKEHTIIRLGGSNVYRPAPKYLS